MLARVVSAHRSEIDEIRAYAEGECAGRDELCRVLERHPDVGINSIYGR